jgi:DNA-binding transcriptional MocR family regulator
MTAKVTFDGAPASGHINFGVGQPSADLLPVELMRDAASVFLESAQPLELNYGERQGDVRFREVLAGFLTQHYDRPASSESLFVTGGNSQALDFICTVFTRPGDTVVVEEPSYFLAFQIFRDHGLNIVGVPTDEHGLDTEQLEHLLHNVKPTLLYTIPSFLNPGGQSLSAERREHLVELSQQHDFLIAADEVYQLLSYYDEPPPALGTRVEEQGESCAILSMGSFSKILAPGLRLGWIQTSGKLMERILANGMVNSGGSFNHFTSHVVRTALELGLQDAHLAKLRDDYRGRLEAMDSALQRHLSDLTRWSKPEGGYFFWLRLNQPIDSLKLRKKAGDFKTGFQAGSVFSSKGSFSNYLRLSFAHYKPAEIREGITRLESLLRSR